MSPLETLLCFQRKQFRFLLAKKSVLDILVDDGEHNGVGQGLDLEALARGQAQENTGGEEVEKRSSRKKINPHFYWYGTKKFYANSIRHGPSERYLPGHVLLTNPSFP